MSLDCESYDALLIDLVERELDETRSAEVRAHAETCESCSRSLARLEGGRRAARELVRAEPPRLDAVMAAARARAAEIRASAVAAEQVRSESIPTPETKPAPEANDGTWLDGALRWLTSWATGPQVAMAAVLVLMIGIGLFNLPQFRAHELAGSDGALVEPDVHAELGPSPADPLDLDVDPRTQRVALGGDHVEEEGAVDPEHDVRPTTTLAQAEHPEITTERTAPHDAPTTGDDTAESALAAADIAPSDGAGRVEEGPLPDLTTPPSEQAVVVAPSVATTSPRPMPPPATHASAPTYDEVERPSAVGMLPTAIHHQARALADAGHCDEAVPRYRTLLAEHPDYGDAPRAMIELADCDRRLGHLDEADRWLTRAETFPSVSAEARRARTVVSAQRRAIDLEAPSAADRSTSSAPSSY